MTLGQGRPRWWSIPARSKLKWGVRCLGVYDLHVDGQLGFGSRFGLHHTHPSKQKEEGARRSPFGSSNRCSDHLGYSSPLRRLASVWYIYR